MLSSNLKELEVHYDGVWLDCPVKGIKYAGLSKFFVHNVDPNHMELAKLFQLVINESRNPKLKPIRAWYQQLNQPVSCAAAVMRCGAATPLPLAVASRPLRRTVDRVMG